MVSAAATCFAIFGGGLPFSFLASWRLWQRLACPFFLFRSALLLSFLVAGLGFGLVAVRGVGLGFGMVAVGGVRFRFRFRLVVLGEVGLGFGLVAVGRVDVDGEAGGELRGDESKDMAL